MKLEINRGFLPGSPINYIFREGGRNAAFLDPIFI